MVRGEYFPKPNDMDTDHDYYWYGSNDATGKLPGMGGVFNTVNLNVYHYAGLNPVKYIDPDGNYFGKDDIAFALGGAVVGLAGQAVGDVISGKMSGWEDYVGSTVGGAAGGWALLYTGPVGAGGASGAVGNATKQFLKNASGKQAGYDLSSFASDTGISAITGLIPGSKIARITSGRGSFNQIYKQIVAKAQNATISSIKFKTALKMFIGRAIDKALVPGTGASVIAGSSGLLPSSEKNKPGDNTKRK